MNIFANQKRIQIQSWTLLVLFLLNVIILAWVNSLLAPRIYARYVFIGTFLYFLIVVLWDMCSYKDGHEVAELLGGKLVSHRTRDESERRLLNVVEEMSIAAGIAIPIVYVLKKELSINAFLAGKSSMDAVIGVTQGALDQLSRDELQAIIAQQFSIIIYDEFSLNQQMSSFVKGFVGIVNFAEKWIRRSHHFSVRVTFVQSFLAVGFWIIGSIGYLLSRILQISIFRKKTELADQVAVQLTRHPESLAKVLYKIDMSESFIIGMSHHEYAHLFFARSESDWLGRIMPLHGHFKKRVSRFYQGDVGTLKLQEDKFENMFGLASKEPILTPRQKNENHQIIKTFPVRYVMSINAAKKILQSVPDVYRSMLLQKNNFRELIFAILFCEQDSKNQEALQLILADLDIAERDSLNVFLTTLKTDSFLQMTAFQIALVNLKTLMGEDKKQFLESVSSFVQLDNAWTFVETIQHLMVQEALGMKQDLSPIADIKIVDLLGSQSIMNSSVLQNWLSHLKSQSREIRTQKLAEAVHIWSQANPIQQKQKDIFRWLAFYWEVQIPMVIWDSNQIE